MSKRERIRMLSVEALSSKRQRLDFQTFEYERDDGSRQVLSREIYHVGDGATALLYDLARRTVILVNQFRLPAYLRGESGWVLETPAGFLDGSAPEVRARDEVAEEAGYRVGEMRKVFEALMIPGCVTHVVHGFVAPYTAADRIDAGGGLIDEGEDIAVVELTIDRALGMIVSGEITDAKTIMLLQHAALHLFH
ncbi:nudix-type nucleoside diphosphatase (YffH/AdpP family) [Paraburkholderia sp. BL23I1N1]|uniref:GDP-mannose pyrophosphatase n=1 Tax=Paraburkholderia sp. BL23I1N1 TaxID=1938802 RepID=UPI000E7111AE|nr:GDP-mannose pyrophosphatase [Paraburkholderia sp. BL23I1N1]RKE26275.1 nudix-type nucleoside diphosphatase (YffH/AdpP family) [Paraburkholderia sp. BL23I1N1]